MSRSHADAIREAERAVVEAAAWTSADTKPPNGLTVLCEVEYATTGQHAFILAEFAPRWTMLASDECENEFPDYDEKGDEYYCPEGWYAWHDKDEISWLVTDKVLAWMRPRPLKKAADALLALRERTCPACGGDGEVLKVVTTKDAAWEDWFPCRECDHSGAIRSTEDTRAKGGEGR